MKTSQNWMLTGLLALAIAAVAGLFLTRSAPDLSSQNKTSQPTTGDSAQINQHYLETAHRLSALATAPEEQQLAQDALRITDRELDLQFAAALEATGSQAVPQTPEVRAIQERIEKIQAAIPAKQDTVKQLTEAAKVAKGDKQEDLQQQLDVAQAELNLHKETLGDAKDDLIRAGGDPHSRVQQLVEEHEAASHAAEAVKFTAPSESAATLSSDSLLAKYSKWNTVRRKQDLISQAQQEAFSAAAELARHHDELERRVEKEHPQTKVAAGQATSPIEGYDEAAAMQIAGVSKKAAAATVASLKRLSANRKSLAILSRRIHDFEELGSTYGRWIGLVEGEQRSALHGIMLSIFWVVLMLLVVFLINRLIDRFFAHLSLEQKQRATLHAVVRFSLQALAVVAILFVVFGRPSQLSTILGLATAGLTVALKDFIVSFMGWFVLMGRNGIRIGDWVEINGVRGEVIEISLLRTVLLETGNWTDAGQPTGRQVAFLNSFAVEGYFFNFSTSGQWLWDEVQVLIPSGHDPYPLIEKIREIVAKETEGNSQSAEHEWQRVKHRYGVRSYSAEPTVTVRPTDNGVAVVVRYVTRANDRSEVRSRLNLAIVNLLHQGAGAGGTGEVVQAPLGVGN